LETLLYGMKLLNTLDGFSCMAGCLVTFSATQAPLPLVSYLMRLSKRKNLAMSWGTFRMLCSHFFISLHLPWFWILCSSNSGSALCYLIGLRKISIMPM